MVLFPEDVSQHISRSLLIVEQLYSIGIVHGDIKPENIMYDSITKKVTLIDFEKGRHTALYAAQEVIKTNTFCRKN